jgi:hypothetical protein
LHIIYPCCIDIPRRYSNQYIGKVKEIGEELRRLYGLTELEARNILFERNVSEYVNKYDRIRNLIPLGVNCNYEDAMMGQCMAISC